MPVQVKSAKRLRQCSEVVLAAPSLKTSERLEILCTLMGEKPLVRLCATDESVQEYLMLAEQVGLEARPSGVRQAPLRTIGLDVYTKTVPWNDPRGRWFSVFLALDGEPVESALRLEKDGGGSEAWGDVLGYPSCCASRYEALSDGTDWLAVVLDRWRSDRAAPLMSNPLARLFTGRGLLPDFFPCSLSCKGALGLASTCHGVLLALRHQDLAASILRELSRPIVRLGQTCLVQIEEIQRLRGSLEFDPRLVLTYGHVPTDLQQLLATGRLPLGDNRYIDHGPVRSAPSQLPSLIEFAL